MAQVHQLGPKVGSFLALFCIHHVNRVNSRNDSESWWPHHKYCPGIIIIIIISIIIITNNWIVAHTSSSFRRSSISFCRWCSDFSTPWRFVARSSRRCACAFSVAIFFFLSRALQHQKNPQLDQLCLWLDSSIVRWFCSETSGFINQLLTYLLTYLHMAWWFELW